MGRHSKDCNCSICTERKRKEYEKMKEMFETGETPEKKPFGENLQPKLIEGTTTTKSTHEDNKSENETSFSFDDDSDFFQESINNFEENGKQNFDEFETVEQEEIPNEQNKKQTSKTAIKGSMLILVIDMFIPPLLALIFSKLKKGRKMDYKNLRLDEDEKADLTELADEAMKNAELPVSPMQAFLISLFFVYGSKVMNNE